jgi:hypothetical protein
MRAAEAKASMLEAERAAAAARAEAEAERESRLGAERLLDTARAEREEEAAALLRATVAGGALQGRLEAAQAECAKLQAKLTELEVQKGGNGGLGGLNLAEMEMGALRGELEGWRLVAVDAQERQQRLEVDLKASQIEIKASCAPTRRLAPQPPRPFSPPPSWPPPLPLAFARRRHHNFFIVSATSSPPRYLSISCSQALQATLADGTSRPTSSEATGAAASAPQSGLSRAACSRNPATSATPVTFAAAARSTTGRPSTFLNKVGSEEAARSRVPSRVASRGSLAGA